MNTKNITIETSEDKAATIEHTAVHEILMHNTTVCRDEYGNTVNHFRRVKADDMSSKDRFKEYTAALRSALSAIGNIADVSSASNAELNAVCAALDKAVLCLALEAQTAPWTWKRKNIRAYLPALASLKCVYAEDAKAENKATHYTEYKAVGQLAKIVELDAANVLNGFPRVESVRRNMSNDTAIIRAQNAEKRAAERAAAKAERDAEKAAAKAAKAEKAAAKAEPVEEKKTA